MWEGNRRSRTHDKLCGRRLKEKRTGVSGLETWGWLQKGGREGRADLGKKGRNTGVTGMLGATGEDFGRVGTVLGRLGKHLLLHRLLTLSLVP